jgi:chitin-binding protein
VTAPRKGTFTVYITKPGYDPAQPLAWNDLDLEHPVATATAPAATGGFHTFSGSLPERSGRQLLYAVWQRSDSPEAFSSCSDVSFGGDSAAGGTAPAPTASAPTEEQIEAGNDKSTIEHHGHVDNDPSTSAEPAAVPENTAPNRSKATEAAPNRPKAAGVTENLAETGGDSSTRYLAIGGAATLALGSSALFLSARRRTVSGSRHGR